MHLHQFFTVKYLYLALKEAGSGPNVRLLFIVHVNGHNNTIMLNVPVNAVTCNS